MIFDLFFYIRFLTEALVNYLLTSVLVRGFSNLGFLGVKNWPNNPRISGGPHRCDYLGSPCKRRDSHCFVVF